MSAQVYLVFSFVIFRFSCTWRTTLAGSSRLAMVPSRAPAKSIGGKVAHPAGVCCFTSLLHEGKKSIKNFGFGPQTPIGYACSAPLREVPYSVGVIQISHAGCNLLQVLFDCLVEKYGFPITVHLELNEGGGSFPYFLPAPIHTWCLFCNLLHLGHRFFFFFFPFPRGFRDSFVPTSTLGVHGTPPLPNPPSPPAPKR